MSAERAPGCAVTHAVSDIFSPGGLCGPPGNDMEDAAAAAGLAAAPPSSQRLRLAADCAPSPPPSPAAAAADRPFAAPTPRAIHAGRLSTPPRPTPAPAPGVPGPCPPASLGDDAPRAEDTEEYGVDAATNDKPRPPCGL